MTGAISISLQRRHKRPAAEPAASWPDKTLRESQERRLWHQAAQVVLQHWLDCSLPEKGSTYSVSQKNGTALACYNFHVHSPILIIFGRNVLRKHAVKWYFAFPPHLNIAAALPGETESQKLRLSLKWWELFCHQTQKTHSYYHLVTAEPPVISRMTQQKHHIEIQAMWWWLM